MIESDQKKVTVDFHWTTESEAGDTESEAGNTGYGVFVKHHYTEEYGPTISVSETEGDYISFPSKMFAEVVDFLRSEGHIEPNKNIVDELIDKANKADSNMKAGLKAVRNRRAALKSKTVLSPPFIENSSAPQEEVETEEPKEIIIDNSNPIGSFDGDDTSYSPPQTPQVVPQTPQTDNSIDNLSPQKMALERQQAVEKQKSETKVIRSSHKEETE